MMRYLCALFLMILFVGCSFQSQPRHKARIVIDQIKDGKVTESVGASLNELVSRDDIEKSLTNEKVTVIPSFVVRDRDLDHYRVKYEGPDDIRLIDVKYDGKDKNIVWDTTEYTVYIIPDASE